MVDEKRNILVSLTATITPDSIWGLEDILEGKTLNDKLKKELKELFMEDIISLIEECEWHFIEVKL